MTAFNCMKCGKYIGWGPGHEGTDHDGTKHICLEKNIKEYEIRKNKAIKLTERYLEELSRV